MKKTNKKLNLSRQTVRILLSEELGSAAGALDRLKWTEKESCNRTCDKHPCPYPEPGSEVFQVCTEKKAL